MEAKLPSSTTPLQKSCLVIIYRRNIRYLIFYFLSTTYWGCILSNTRIINVITVRVSKEDAGGAKEPKSTLFLFSSIAT